MFGSGYIKHLLQIFKIQLTVHVWGLNLFCLSYILSRQLYNFCNVIYLATS